MLVTLTPLISDGIITSLGQGASPSYKLIEPVSSSKKKHDSSVTCSCYKGIMLAPLGIGIDKFSNPPNEPKVIV